jgi:aspartate-semialdehyde dehydrogenase
MSAGGTISKEWSPRIGKTGALVIDNSSAWRYDQDVPLIVPEVNAHVLEQYMARAGRKNIIANPNCSTAQLVVALKPLHDAAKIKRVVVSTYQSVSGAGKEAMDELWTQTKGIFVTDAPTPQKFTKQIAFNVIPHIDVFMDSGDTKEEWKMGRDQEDPRPEDQAHRNLRARAGVCRPCRGRQHRVRTLHVGRGSPEPVA